MNILDVDCALKQSHDVEHYVQYQMTPALCYSGTFGFGFVIVYNMILLTTLISKRFICRSTRLSSMDNKLYYISVTFYSSLCIAFAMQLYTLTSFGEFFISENPYRKILYAQYLFELIYHVSGYIFVAMQLVLSLKGSAFALPQSVIKLHMVIVINTTICSILRIILYVTNHFTSARNVGAFMTFIVVLGLFHILYTFDRKLYWFIVHANASKSNSKIDMNHKDFNKMFKVITKISLLMSIVVGIGICHIIIAIIDGLTSGHQYYIIYVCSQIVYIFAVTLCIFLTLSMNQNLYHILCSKCDKKCIQACKSLAHSSVAKQMELRRNINFMTQHGNVVRRNINLMPQHENVATNSYVPELEPEEKKTPKTPKTPSTPATPLVEQHSPMDTVPSVKQIAFEPNIQSFILEDELDDNNEPIDINTIEHNDMENRYQSTHL